MRNDYVDTLQPGTNLAWIYWKQGCTGNVIELFKTVREKEEQILEEGHLENLQIIDSLAMLYQEDRCFNKAKEKYEKLLKIMEGFRERDTPIYVTEYNFAWVYGLQDQIEKAIQMLEELLEKVT